MNRLKLIMFMLLLISCGRSTTFRLDNFRVHLIHELKTDSVHCVLFVEGDTIVKNIKTGINLTFNVSYSGSSGGIEPGIGGTKDSIVSLKIFLETKTQHLNITNDLYNIEQSQYFVTNFSRYDYRCTCYDSLKKSYYNYVHDKSYEKPTIYTYNKENEDIVYWPNGDTSIYKGSTPIDMSSYETFFINVSDFVSSYNKLYLKKIKTSTYKSFKIINAGHDMMSNDFYFWIPKELISQMNKGDIISVVIVLSDNRKLIDKVMIK